MSGLLLAPAVQAQMVAATQISNWPLARIILWTIGLLAIFFGILTITRRNPVGAVMSLVATFFCLAATYAMLFAHFLAAVQVLVYAGAIMVLFIFVVMVLNRDETDAVSLRGVVLKGVIGVPAIFYLVFKLGWYLMAVVPAHPEDPPASFGTVAEVGNLLFTDYLFGFEAVSVLLLIAVIAAVVVARTHKHAGTPPGPPATPAPGGHH
jgi:NADH-quinone oxidoreductase subunit J